MVSETPELRVLVTSGPGFLGRALLRELLSERQLDDGLVLAGPKEGASASEDRNQENGHRPHHRGHFV